MLTTVSDKGQVVIPVEIRRRLGITPGCQLDFSLEGHVILILSPLSIWHAKESGEAPQSADIGAWCYQVRIPEIHVSGKTAWTVHPWCGKASP